MAQAPLGVVPQLFPSTVARGARGSVRANALLLSVRMIILILFKRAPVILVNTGVAISLMLFLKLLRRELKERLCPYSSLQTFREPNHGITPRATA